MLPNYSRFISKCSRIDRDTQLELVRKWRATGDLRYRDRVITANLKLAMHLSLKNRWYSNVEVSDLIQLANLALLHAIERFDPERGIAFATFAVWCIRSFHTQYILDNHPVRMNTSAGRRKILNRRADLLSIQNIIDPQERIKLREQLAKQCDTSIDQVEACESMHLLPASIEKLQESDHDIIADIDSQRVRNILQSTLQKLPARTQEILCKRFVDNEHFHKIGSRYGCSRERIRKEVLKTCHALRHNNALKAVYE